MTPRHVLLELLERLGLPGATLERDGAYRITFDGELSVACRCDSRAVLLESRVSSLPADTFERARVAEALLVASASTLREQPSVLCLEPTGSSVMLYRSVPVDGIGVTGVREALEEFLASLERWRSTAAECLGKPSSGATGRAGGPFEAGDAALRVWR